MGRSFCCAGLCAVLLALTMHGAPPRRPRNIIIFVADGLRHGSINPQDTKALWALRRRGVDFQNSYSLFPTFTMANASAIATGHALGDTGTFSNTIWDPVSPAESPVRFIESDHILAELNAHYQGNYLGEPSLLALARARGYNTAAVGKSGPVALQDLEALGRKNSPKAIIVDDETGTRYGVPLTEEVLKSLRKEHLPPEAPTRSNGYRDTSLYNNGNRGDVDHSGTLSANLVQQQWMIDVTTRVILPLFAAEEKPFILLYWSRDPDATQHYQGDSQEPVPGDPGKVRHVLQPGINGETSRASVQNADRNLQQILDWLTAHPDIQSNTDIFVTSDHGFAAISRREIGDGTTQAESAQHLYVDAKNQPDTEKGTLPNGFLAIDLARALHTNLWDPDRPGTGESQPFRQVDLSKPEHWEHPASGNGFLGEKILKKDGSDALAIVAANGGSDLIYVPSQEASTVRHLVDQIAALDYVGGIFVDDRFDDIPGTLPLSEINLIGSARLPRPAIVVAFKVFYPGENAGQPDWQKAALISDTTLQEGQGMHGGFGRDNTFNFMTAAGPDFKQGFADSAPVSNADIAPTLAYLMGIEFPVSGLRGRVIDEALRSGPRPAVVSKKSRSSRPGHDERRTVLVYEEYPSTRGQKPERYLYSAEFRQ
ncbi:MAG TPA: alkaline phosphatase family protein [Candidatus Angelobacter sp.]|nr:alkaline phosphatase family protein [Candidatus Angelobacter sp.]